MIHKDGNILKELEEDKPILDWADIADMADDCVATDK